MINVTVYRNDGKINGFELSGHAESGPLGQDLVCAAVSAVSFGSVNAIEKLCEIEPMIDQGGEGGYLRVQLPKDLQRDSKQQAELLLEGMVISLETIAYDYGQFIAISKN